MSTENRRLINLDEDSASDSHLAAPNAEPRGSVQDEQMEIHFDTADLDDMELLETLSENDMDRHQARGTAHIWSNPTSDALRYFYYQDLYICPECEVMLHNVEDFKIHHMGASAFDTIKKHRLYWQSKSWL